MYSSSPVSEVVVGRAFWAAAKKVSDERPSGCSIDCFLMSIAPSRTRAMTRAHKAVSAAQKALSLKCSFDVTFCSNIGLLNSGNTGNTISKKMSTRPRISGSESWSKGGIHSWCAVADLSGNRVGVTQTGATCVPVSTAEDDSETDPCGNCDGAGLPRLRIGRSCVHGSLKSAQF